MGVGSNVRYTIVATNIGPSTVSNVVVTDPLPAGMTFVPAGSSSICSASGGTVTCSVSSLNSTQSATMTIVATANTVGIKSNTATVSATGDPNSANNASTADATVTEVNAPPVTTPDSTTTAEDTALVFPAADLVVNDSRGAANESGQTLTVLSVGDAIHGLVELNGGSITFTPDPDFNGLASFSYTVWDDGTTNGQRDPRSAVGLVTVTVTELNDTPIAADDIKSVPADGVLSFPETDLTANDSPGPSYESGQTLTVTAVTATSSTHGTVSLSGGTVT